MGVPSGFDACGVVGTMIAAAVPDDCDTPGMDEYNQQMLEQEVAVKIGQWQKNQGDVPGTLKRRSDKPTEGSSPSIRLWR